MIQRLAFGDWHAEVLPDIGGGLARLTWAGHDVLRPAPLGTTDPLSLACFPLVPYSNRIAAGTLGVPPNRDWSPFPIHGVGWLERWDVAEKTDRSVKLCLEYRERGWPWPFLAELIYDLTDDRLDMTLSVNNQGLTAMPTGLGFHPYFLRAGATPAMDFKGYWKTDKDCLPTHHQPLQQQKEWLKVGLIDTVFTGRQAEMEVDYPWGRVALLPSANLPFTVIYTPPGDDYFCIEPVSHSTDAINRAPDEMIMLEPAEVMSATFSLSIDAT